MSDTRKHTLWAVEAHTTLIPGITRQAVRTGSDVRGESTSGEIWPRFLSMIGQNPGAEFATRAIATAWGICGLTGKSLGDLTTGLKMYAQKHVHGGKPATGSNHRKYTFVKGILIPVSLSVDHQGDAELSYLVAATWDGVNDPVVVTDSVALPGGLTDAERFTLGPFTIESVAIGQIRSLNIDFGITATPEGADSDVWPRMVSIEQIVPRITLRGTDVEWLKAANIPLSGKAVTHANTTIYLRRRKAGAAYYLNNESQHIKISAAGMATISDAFDAAGSGRSEITLDMPLNYDGTNDPITLTSGQQIT